MTTTTPLPALIEEEVAAILAHGWSLAWNRKGNRATVEDAVWFALEDAIEVVDASPDRERFWLRSGTRAGPWKAATIMIKAELRELEKIRVLSNMRLSDGPARIHRERDMDLAMNTLDLMMHVRAARGGDRLAKATIVLLRGDEKAVASKIWRPDRPHDRRDPHMIRKTSIRAVLTGIERQLGKVPDFERRFSFA